MLGLAGFSYGLYTITIKLANIGGFLREDLMAGQYLLGAIVLGILALAKCRYKLNIKQIGKLMIVGVFAAACGACMYENVRATSTSFAVTMLFQYVWIGILLDCLITRKLPSKQVAGATILVMLGTPLAAGLVSSGTTVNLEGLFWGFGSAISYAGMLLCSSRFETQAPTIIRTFWVAIGQTLFATITGPKFYITAIVDPGVFVYVIPLTLVAVLIPCLLIMRYSPMVPIGITNIMTGFELPTVVVLGALLFREPHDVFTIAGVAIICVGIVVANWDSIIELREANTHV